MIKRKLLISSENPAAYKVFSETLDENIFIIDSYPSKRLKGDAVLDLAEKKRRYSLVSDRFRKYMYDNRFGVVFYYFFIKYFLSLAFFVKVKIDILKINKLFSLKGYDAVVISSDRGISSDLRLSLWARKNSKKVVLLEYAYSAGFESASKSRRLRAFSFLASRSSASFCGLRFYLPHHEMALKWLGAMPFNPWVLGSGISDSVIVSTEFERDRLVSNGVLGEKVEVLGAVQLDEVLRKAKEGTGIVEQANESCLLAVPQYWEHNLLDRTTHFDVIEEMLNILSSRFQHVYASLHPKMSKSNYENLAKKYDIEILDRPLSESMNLANYFISTYSSTVLWALLTEKRIIIIDHANLNYSDFYSDAGLKMVYSNRELDSLLKSCDWVGIQKKVVYDSSLAAKKRINNFIYQVIENENNR